MTHTDIAPTVLLTGPTSGIGEQMLTQLVRHPSRPRLILMARDAAALDTAVDSARARGLTAHGIRMDLGDLVGVGAGLEELSAAQRVGDLGRVDVALLNAGAQFAERRRTSAQGYESTFAVNVLAQHLLLRGLEPLLAPGAHVIGLGSSTHRGKRASFNLVPDPEWDTPDALARPDSSASGTAHPTEDRRRGGVAYATSKLALVTMSHDWASRLGAAGRRLNLYDPGLVPGTGLGKDLPPNMYWVWKNVMPAMSVLPGASTPRATARHAVALAMGDTFPTLNDGYLEIGRLTRAEPATFDPGRREQLWAWLERTVERYVPARTAEAPID